MNRACFTGQFFCSTRRSCRATSSRIFRRLICSRTTLMSCSQQVLHLCHGMRTTLTQGMLLSCIVRAGDGTPFSKSELLKYLLEGTVDSGLLPESLDGEDGEHGTVEGSTAISPSQGSSSKWIKIREGKPLQEALQHKDYIIPAVPVFFVVSRKSAFYSKFKAGNWSLP
uniref:Uncharacterized protein n=1 Tax=Aegilops tauschii subsp. strangulata TaxID=200361 RepID=A0A453LSU9_AEGTS